ncbi:MAG: NAD(P)-dependent oxidoreductase [Armatimonadetes bacterium]|nr:NAD(P)-dependent oxidoreductase [Armatimonadota bacterium]
MRERILITGPCGRVGTKIVPLLREYFALRLFDIQPMQPEGDDEVIQGDIRDFDSVKKACEGVKAVLHLAAVSDEDDFYTRLLPMNLLGVYNVFEAARQAGVQKVIFASTCQTILGYPEDWTDPKVWITPEMPVRPITVYACTKVFGEALARYYADKFGMSMICIRIGWFLSYDNESLRKHQWVLSMWCSPRDLTQLVVKSINSDIRFAIFFGVSNNPKRFWDISNAQQLIGYEPQDNAADYFVGEE